MWIMVHFFTPLKNHFGQVKPRVKGVHLIFKFFHSANTWETSRFSAHSRGNMAWIFLCVFQIEFLLTKIIFLHVVAQCAVNRKVASRHRNLKKKILGLFLISFTPLGFGRFQKRNHTKVMHTFLCLLLLDIIVKPSPYLGACKCLFWPHKCVDRLLCLFKWL